MLRSRQVTALSKLALVFTLIVAVVAVGHVTMVRALSSYSTVHDVTEFAPFELTYGYLVDSEGVDGLLVSLDLTRYAPLRADSATATVYDDVWEPIGQFETQGSYIPAWHLPVEAHDSAYLEIVGGREPWTIALDLVPVPEGFRDVTEVRINSADGDGAGYLEWDRVPGAYLYEIGVEDPDGMPQPTVRTTEPWMSLADMKPGQNLVTVWVYSADPATPQRVKAVNVAVGEPIAVDVPEHWVGDATGTISGAVRFGEELAEGVAVSLWPRSHAYTDTPTVNFAIATAQSDANGVFEFTGVPEGRYSVIVSGSRSPELVTPSNVVYSTTVVSGRTTNLPIIHVVENMQLLQPTAPTAVESGQVLFEWLSVEGARSYAASLRELPAGTAGQFPAAAIVDHSELRSPTWRARLEAEREYELTVYAWDAMGTLIATNTVRVVTH